MATICAFVVAIGGLAWLANAYEQLTATHPSMTRSNYWIFTAVFGTVCVYMAIIYWLFPRCAFETVSWSRRQKWRTWAAEGFATLVVFDTVLLTLGKRLLSLVGLNAG